MTQYFRKAETNEQVNLLDYCVERLNENPHVKIHLGTDSQNRKRYTVYTTVVVFRYNLRGAHFIYRTSRVPRIKDRFSRLWKECELSVEIAEWLKENSAIRIDTIELDYNNLKQTESTSLVKPTSGWVESLGYKAATKPNQLIAIRAADYQCRS